MKKQKELSVPALGGSSLLVIFAVLCLVVFALLSLNTVLAEQRLSRSYGEAVENWHGADLRAQEIYAKLRAGETVPGVEERDGQYTYRVAVSEHQSLQVVLRNDGGSWKVILWQTVAQPEDADERLPVWQG